MKKTVSILLMAVMLISMCGFTSTEVKGATKVTLNRKTATVSVGCDTKLQLKNAVSTVKWKSADESIAKVSAYGTVTGIKKGTTKISATYKKKTYKCTVTVKSSRISTKKRIIPVDQFYQLWVLRRMPKDKETVDDVKVTSTVTWKSSDTEIATVNKNGRVTAKKEGTAKITAKVKGETYSCVISVVKALGYDDFAYNPDDEMAETYSSSFFSNSKKEWRYVSEYTDDAREYSHLSGLLKIDSTDYWFRCYENGKENQENRGIVIGDTIEDVWEKFGQSDGEINKGPTDITNRYTGGWTPLKNKEDIAYWMTYSYKDTRNSKIVDYEKRFYFNEDGTLILIEWSMKKN